MSALLVGKSLVYFLESDFSLDAFDFLSEEDARQFVIRREILRAIAAHTCPEIYHLRFDTLAFLLFIVDELQCWGRPTFEQLRGRALSSDDDEVEIREFRKDHIEIDVKVEKEWEDRKKDIKNQLGDIRKRLRLAVGTPELKGLTLRYSVKHGQDAPRSLELADGRIRQEPAR